MNRSRLPKIERELIELSHAPRGKKAGVFIALAQKLGRTRVNRGKEPTYERKIDPVFKFPLTIPNHPGDMKPGTARSIIDALMNDVELSGRSGLTRTKRRRLNRITTMMMLVMTLVIRNESQVPIAHGVGK